jgi:predicted ABC-type ATPase
MPVLYILAGPNGTGKTTYYYSALGKHFIDRQLPFLNVDVIAKDELGGYTEENFARAEMIYRDRIKALIGAKSDFMIESNMARSTDYDWLEKMMQQNYSLVLHFLCTDDVAINVNRVLRRVKEGGHNIPESIILHRYKMGLTYLKGKLHLFKEAHLIDNSSDEPIQVAQIIEGKLTESIHNLPKWANDLLFIIRRMK